MMLTMLLRNTKKVFKYEKILFFCFKNRKKTLAIKTKFK